MSQEQNHSSEPKPSPSDTPTAVPLQPVVGRWKIAYRLLLWSWLLIPLILAYAFLCLVAWAGERAEHGKARLYSRVDKWNPYPANHTGQRTGAIE